MQARSLMRHNPGGKRDRGIGGCAQDVGTSLRTCCTRQPGGASTLIGPIIDAAAQDLDRRSARERSPDIHIHVDLTLWKCILALPSRALSVVFPYERHQDDLASAGGWLS
jgi:hypothetical protein